MKKNILKFLALNCSYKQEAKHYTNYRKLHFSFFWFTFIAKMFYPLFIFLYLIILKFFFILNKKEEKKIIQKKERLELNRI